jgi:putative membrane-bound dehydrogenase-like protein
MRRSVLGSFLFIALTGTTLAQTDPMPPERTAALMKVPDGFHVTLFAGEPDVLKPIAMTLDDRGRLWVVESHSYPKWIRDSKPGKDRILIFEDTKGTGHFDKRTVFLDNGTNLSGIALGFGGVWLCATPNLLFIPLKPGEHKPAGPPEILLDGWSLDAQHNVFNTLTWGPDGWLYGCNGITATSKVGKPGTQDDKRIPMNCGVWRYHPTKKVFEVFAWGTTNPWGLDFDERGEMFITNCVIKHLFHVVQGGHYERMFGQDLNPHVYGLIQSCADHYHWAGGDWTTSRGGQGAHSDAGGGHAHAGCMIYLGDNWPDEYRGKVFMGNIHGNRINMDILERKGSGYVAHHGKDFLTCADPWFRPLAIMYGPDGGVYLSDWHDTGECHNNEKTHPSGRIYKITCGKPRKLDVDLAKLSDAELIKLQSHKNEWYVRHARRLLQERAHAGKITTDAIPSLIKMFITKQSGSRRLRALWTLHALDLLGEAKLQGLLQDEDDVRSWAVRLLGEVRQPTEITRRKLVEMSRSDPSSAVRLTLASAMQRWQPNPCLEIAYGLLDHPQDAADANLPLMLWYGIETWTFSSVDEVKNLLDFKRPLLVHHLARRMANDEEQRKLLYSILQMEDSPEHRETIRNLLSGMYEGLKGQSSLEGPDSWRKTLRHFSSRNDPEIREKATFLAVLYGDREAIGALLKKVEDRHSESSARKAALQTLVDAKSVGLINVLEELLTDPGMRGPALRALSAQDSDRVPALILERYASFSEREKADAVATLTSRTSYATALLDAMAAGKVPRRDLSAFAARQLLTFKDGALTEKLTKVWGTLRSTQNKPALLAKYFGIVAPEARKKADRSHGRFVFNQTCAKCHTLFGDGGKIGPDLTGSQRANAEYLLTKLLDPSAVVAKDYQMTIISTKQGRTLSGIVKEENDKVVALQTENEVVRIAKVDIEARDQSKQSMMPEGQLEKMSEAEVRNLFAYLSGAQQVPLPKK